jgi:hypothetical protein
MRITLAFSCNYNEITFKTDDDERLNEYRSRKFSDFQFSAGDGENFKIELRVARAKITAIKFYDYSSTRQTLE